MEAAADSRGICELAGTRMRWAWDLEPHGGLKLMGPLITLMGRRQERTIWTRTKRVLEAPETSVNSCLSVAH